MEELDGTCDICATCIGPDLYVGIHVQHVGEADTGGWRALVLLEGLPLILAICEPGPVVHDEMLGGSHGYEPDLGALGPRHGALGGNDHLLLPPSPAIR